MSKQAGRWRRGASGTARGTRADTTCDATMVAWHRAGRHGAGRRGAGRRGAGRSQAAARWALRLMWRTWVGVVSLMRVPGEGGDRRVPDTSSKAEN